MFYCTLYGTPICYNKFQKGTLVDHITLHLWTVYPRFVDRNPNSFLVVKKNCRDNYMQFLNDEDALIIGQNDYAGGWRQHWHT